jgi:hypothetical protein
VYAKESANQFWRDVLQYLRGYIADEEYYLHELSPEELRRIVYEYPPMAAKAEQSKKEAVDAAEGEAKKKAAAAYGYLRPSRDFALWLRTQGADCRDRDDNRQVIDKRGATVRFRGAEPFAVVSAKRVQGADFKKVYGKDKEIIFYQKQLGDKADFTTVFLSIPRREEEKKSNKKQ